MPDINYYDALGIQRGASPADIRAAWKNQSIKLHPDHNRFGVELQKLVNEAYSVLSDITKRRRYDSNLASGAHTSRHNEPHYPDVTELEQKLAESKRKCTMLKKKLVSVQKEAGSAREQVLEVRNELAEKTREADCARDEADNTRNELAKTNLLLSKKETLCEQLQYEQTKLQNEIKIQRDKSELLEEESLDQLLYYQDKLDEAGRELREERKRSADYAKAEQKAANEANNIKMTLTYEVNFYQEKNEVLEKESADQRHLIDICQDKIDRER